ncbi:hypothetical protein ABIE78_005214 [Sinorhizobium fredii]|uniref:Uncharacterized protein n=1 Tax=Sinorhizobium fredii (strain USDA 257) TaxID=1185652 RepID=I3WZG8_SINF2|nr:hypothetical protein [Sinorhizobium fredii]AFL49024.1 hypothetical protein USDA257_c04270 [Sinorhizobium fredii USDA 257]
MIPIRLNWQLLTDGFEPVEFKNSNGSKVTIAEPGSARTDPILYEAIHLEDPVVLHFINCETDMEFIAFLARFGTLEETEISKSDEIEGDIEYTLGSFQKPRSSGYRRPAGIGSNSVPVILTVLRDRALSLKALINATRVARHIDAKTKVRDLNELMDSAEVIVHPCFVHSEGTMRFVLKADTLWDFMVMEVAAIYEAGAVATSCEHCRTIFLTGPLTGRRSHAKYCSDRCRVAAMRARNSAKEG